jgi:hypothetical protein
MHGVCRASVGRVQVKGSGEEPDIVLFRIAKKTQEIKEREACINEYWNIRDYGTDVTEE